jgi:hypothetical protein
MKEICKRLAGSWRMLIVVAGAVVMLLISNSVVRAGGCNEAGEACSCNEYGVCKCVPDALCCALTEGCGEEETNYTGFNACPGYPSKPYIPPEINPYCWLFRICRDLYTDNTGYTEKNGFFQ